MGSIVTGPSAAFVQAQQASQPQQVDVGRLLALRNQLQNAPIERQILQQQAQAGDLENQQKQQALKDQQAMTQAMQQWDGKDINSLVPLAAKNGASANAILGLKSKFLEQQQMYSKMAADDATTGAKNLETQKGKNDMIAGRLQTVMQLPDDQLSQGVTQAAQDLVQQGLLDPQHGQTAAQLAQLPPAQIRTSLGTMQKGLMSETQLMENALKTAQTGEATSRAHEADVNATLAPQRLANEQANQRAERAQRQQGLNIEAARLNFERNRAGIDPNGSANTLAEAIAQGHITPDRMGYLLSRNPDLLQGVMKADPTFDSSKAQTYPAVYKDFTSGKTSVALNAGATALGHLQELKNMNTVESHIPGTPDYNAYMNKVDTVATELAKFYGDSTVSGISAIRKTLASQLPGTRDAAIKTQAQSMGDKLDAYQQQWQNAAPSKAYQAPMPGISPRAQAARVALAGGGATSSLTVTAPNGKTYTFKDQASADAFKKNAGIQ